MKTLSKIIFIICLVGCTDRNKVPSQYLQPATMQAILMDVLIIDAINSTKDYTLRPFSLNDVNSKAALKILSNHKISVAEFKKSYEYYLAHPDLLKPIADSLVAQATRFTTKMYSDTLKLTRDGNYLKNVSRPVRN